MSSSGGVRSTVTVLRNCTWDALKRQPRPRSVARICWPVGSSWAGWAGCRVGIVGSVSRDARPGNDVGVDLQPDGTTLARDLLEVIEHGGDPFGVGVVEGGAFGDVDHLERPDAAR